MATATETQRQNGELTRRTDHEAGFSSSDGFALIQRAATLLSNSSLVPKEYQGNMPNCVVALNMANRIGADPLMVMQNLYVVHGRPGWSAQFLIATFNQCGRFSALRYEWNGKEGTDAWKCRAYATELTTGEVLYGSWVSIELAKKENWYSKNGSKWQSMPQQMLMYRSAAWFVRAYAPEIAMGLHTADEIADIGPERQPQPAPARIDNSQASDALADRLEGVPTTTADNGPPLDRQILDRISSAKTPDDIDDIAGEIAAAVNDDRLTADQAAGLTQELQDREAVLSGKGKAGK